MLRWRISPELCWDQFVDETGSELINGGCRIFLDAVSLGGDAEEVGSRASLLTMKVDQMRARRQLVSSTFGWLSVVLHATLVFLLALVIEIVGGFGTVVAAAGVQDLATGQGLAGASAFSFSFASIDYLRVLMSRWYFPFASSTLSRRR